MLASTTLSKAAFLSSVLLEEQESWHLAFQIGMFVLEMPRPPASCKAMEVRDIWTCCRVAFIYHEMMTSFS